MEDDASEFPNDPIFRMSLLDGESRVSRMMGFGKYYSSLYFYCNYINLYVFDVKESLSYVSRVIRQINSFLFLKLCNEIHSLKGIFEQREPTRTHLRWSDDRTSCQHTNEQTRGSLGTFIRVGDCKPRRKKKNEEELLHA